MSTGHARTLLALGHPDQQRRIARQIIDGGLSVRVTENIVQKIVEGKSTRSTPTPRVVDPNVRAAETKLRRALGTQVKILMSEQGKGKVEISFFNSQDLDRIYNLLVNSPQM